MYTVPPEKLCTVVRSSDAESKTQPEEAPYSVGPSVISFVFQLIIWHFPHYFCKEVKLGNHTFSNVCYHLNKTTNEDLPKPAAAKSPSPQLLQNWPLTTIT